MASIPDHIFRAYDIRGIVGDGLNPAVMELLGRAIASEALDQGETRLIVANDIRLSSPRFCDAMVDGILSTGCDAVLIGSVPTPLMYFATHILDTASGVMITGSHNPKNYNGVKIVLKQQCLADNQISNLKHRIALDNFRSGSGNLETENVVNRYMERIAADVTLKQKMKVVVDSGNGVASLIAPALFEKLGCQVIPLFCKPDGNFPNHHPDPSNPDNLQALIREVLAEQADLGIAFDGDADRLGLVTSSGRILNADHMLMSFVQDILPENPGAKVIYDVKSSRHLKDMILAEGGEPVMCKSGHSFVKQKMQQTGALLGGEYSAHLFFMHRWYGFDDGLYAAARFLELMDKHSRSADGLLDRLPVSYTTGELKIPVSEGDKFHTMNRLQEEMTFPDAKLNTLDGVRANFVRGWGLVRASNTTPCLILRFEADSPEALDAIKLSFRKEIQRIDPSLSLDVLDHPHL